MLPRHKKALFISILAFAGIAVGLAVGAVLLHAGILHFSWYEPTRLARERSANFRILVLGDSFLGEWPIRHCLAKDLARYCSSHGIGLMNTSVGGSGPLEYLDQLEREGPGFRPQVVLLFYYAGNDLTDVMYRKTAYREPGQAPMIVWPTKGNGEPVHWAPEANAAQTPASDSPLTTTSVNASASARAGNETERQHPEFDWAAIRARGIDEDLIQKAQARLREPKTYGPGRFVSPYFLEIGLKGPRFLKDNLLVDTPESQAVWKTSEEKLSRIASLCKELGAQLVVVAIPHSLQVDRSHFDFYKKLTVEIDESLLTTTRPQQLLSEFCSKNGSRFVDLLPSFKTRPSPPYTYFWENDDHFSEEGHTLAFETLRAQFLDQWTSSNTNP